MAQRIPARLTPAEGRKFAFPVGIAFAVLASITWWRDHQTLMYFFSGLSGLLLIAGILIPGYLGPVYRAWMGFAHVISKVTTPIFMGIVYFGIIGPTGTLMRVFGRNPIRRKPEGGSFWVSHRSGTDSIGDMRNQF